MRKPLFSRAAGLTILYCAVFFVLVLLQFSGKGNFSLSTGAITIRGRYLKESHLSAQSVNQVLPEGIREITGGVKLFYGGLEFSLNVNRGKGLALLGAGGALYVDPEYLILAGNTVRFGLPGGTELVFSSFDSQRGNELKINAEFADNVSKVIIPITLRRSSLTRDNGQLGVWYGGSVYSFGNTGSELENGVITLSSENLFISYRSRDKLQIYEPADYIIGRAQNYQNEIQNWKDINFSRWNLNAPSMQNEDDIIAFFSESLARGNYLSATASIPRNFINSSRQTYRSALYAGGISNAYRLLTLDEREKLNLITNLTTEGSLEIFKEAHILEFLYNRNNASLANNIINLIQNANPESLVSDYCPGLLEAYIDFRLWYPSAENPVERLTEQILLLVSESLNRMTENDLVLASNSEGINSQFSLRLGKALISWAEINQNTDWENIGKSLILSALADNEDNAGKFYNILNLGENNPRAARLTESHWTWTVSSSVRASYTDGNLNISVNFPVNQTHYMIIYGVRQFLRIQIHGIDFRTDSQFEQYDSSGWMYYPQDQILILKLKHRVTVENVRVFYRAEEPPRIEERVETDQTNITMDAAGT